MEFPGLRGRFGAKDPPIKFGCAADAHPMNTIWGLDRLSSSISSLFRGLKSRKCYVWPNCAQFWTLETFFLLCFPNGLGCHSGTLAHKRVQPRRGGLVFYFPCPVPGRRRVQTPRILGPEIWPTTSRIPDPTAITSLLSHSLLPWMRNWLLYIMLGRYVHAAWLFCSSWNPLWPRLPPPPL